MRNKKVLMTCLAILFFSAVFYQMAILAMAITYPSYNNEADCRTCHGITVDRHHLLVANGTHQCTDCHAMKYDDQNQTYYPEVIRNCLTCHPGKNHTDTHHLLLAQGLFVCSDCHTMKYDNQSQSYYPEVIWDCTKCHSTVLRLNDTPPPIPTSIPPEPPSVGNFSPSSPVNDIVGTTRKFNISISQTVNLTWYINDNPVQSNNSVTNASYTNTSAGLGVWNVSIKASNNNGNVTFTWIWNVTTLPPPPDFTSFAPASPVNDTVGSSRKFGITTSQPTNVIWYINDNPVQSNNDVMGASYDDKGTSVGTRNVKAVATNANGGVMHSWTWNVYQVVPSITVSSPNGGVGVSYKRGTTQTIKWTNVGKAGSYVKIELLKGTSASTITSKVSNTGTYKWKISSSQAVATNYKIRVTSTANSLYKDTSDNYFSITK